jgi:hypothetical protein
LSPPPPATRFSGKGTAAFKEAAGTLAGKSVTSHKTAATIIYS